MKLKYGIVGVLAVLMAGFGGAVFQTPASMVSAQVADSEVVFRRKRWEVRIVEFSDNSYACVAEVDTGKGSFMVWTSPDSAPQLQFYSTAWQFEDEVADIQLQIDRRGVWDLSNAQLNENSVFFTMSDDDSAIRFLKEVMRGNTPKLMNENGRRIENYSLSGSSASILALVECDNALDDYDGDNNPFN